MNAALSPVEKTPEVEEEGEVSSDGHSPLRKFSASEQSPFTPDDIGLIGARKRPLDGVDRFLTQIKGDTVAIKITGQDLLIEIK